MEERDDDDDIAYSPDAMLSASIYQAQTYFYFHIISTYPHCDGMTCMQWACNDEACAKHRSPSQPV
jgi:hypothetical protein